MSKSKYDFKELRRIINNTAYVYGHIIPAVEGCSPETIEVHWNEDDFKKDLEFLKEYKEDVENYFGKKKKGNGSYKRKLLEEGRISSLERTINVLECASSLKTK